MGCFYCISFVILVQLQQLTQSCCCLGQVPVTPTSSHSDTTLDTDNDDDDDNSNVGNSQRRRPLLAVFDSCLTFAATQATNSFQFLHLVINAPNTIN